MTVRDLIARLEKCDPDRLAVIEIDTEDGPTNSMVESVTYEPDGSVLLSPKIPEA